MISKVVCIKCFKNMCRTLNWEFNDADLEGFKRGTWFCPYHKGKVKEKDEVPSECEFSLEHIVNREVKD